MLGWEIDTGAMTVTQPTAKLLKLRDLLRGWPVDRIFTSEKEVRSLLEKQLHVCDAVRGGTFLVRCMLNQLGLSPIKIWQGQFLTSRVTRRTRFKLKPEFHADVEFWQSMLEAALGSASGTLHAPLYSFCRQPHSRILWSDASGDAMGGYCLESGAWWRVDFSDNVEVKYGIRCAINTIYPLMFSNYWGWL